MLLDFLNQDRPLDRPRTACIDVRGGGIKVLWQRLQPIRPPSLRMGELEIVTNHVRSDHLHESDKRIRMVRFKIAEKAKIIGAQLEIGFLNEIIDSLRR